MLRRARSVVVLCLFFGLSVIAAPALSQSTSKDFLGPLAPGLEYGTIPWIGASPQSDSLLYVIRFDPAHWQILALAADSSETLNAEEWAHTNTLSFVTNAGMYGEDGREHVGYFRSDGKVHTSYIHPRYESVIATDPIDPDDDPFGIFDTDLRPIEEILSSYDTVIQNLRLIRSPRENRWSAQDRQWAEMSVAEDDRGRIVFLFTPIPISMYEWNGWLLSLPLGIVNAQHLEGRSDAQFYLRVGEFEVSQIGQTGLGLGFHRRNGTPLPNVLGMIPRTVGADVP